MLFSLTYAFICTLYLSIPILCTCYLVGELHWKIWWTQNFKWWLCFGLRIVSKSPNSVSLPFNANGIIFLSLPWTRGNNNYLTVAGWNNSTGIKASSVLWLGTHFLLPLFCFQLAFIGWLMYMQNCIQSRFCWDKLYAPQKGGMGGVPINLWSFGRETTVTKLGRKHFLAESGSVQENVNSWSARTLITGQVHVTIQFC